MDTLFYADVPFDEWIGYMLDTSAEFNEFAHRIMPYVTEIVI